MPEISRFFGIIIRMFYDDHPPKHFHVQYNDYIALICIESLEVMEGKLPKRILSLVVEWGRIHQAELIENWKLSEKEKPLNKIKPLE